MLYGLTVNLTLSDLGAPEFVSPLPSDADSSHPGRDDRLTCLCRRADSWMRWEPVSAPGPTAVGLS